MKETKKFLKKTWVKLGVLGRFAIGILIIILGSVLSRMLIDAMLRTDNFMFNPIYKDTMFRHIFIIPLAVYGAVYIICYWWFAQKNTGDASIYKYLPIPFFIAVVLQISILMALIITQGFWSDAQIFAYTGSACSAVTFGIALFCVKPF